MFCSANDTLREVFSSLPSGSSPHTSPRKRGRSVSFHEPESGGALDEDGDAGMLHTNPEPEEEFVTLVMGSDAKSDMMRPIKPLRRSRRTLMETRSLPVGLLRFSGESTNHDNMSPANPEMEKLDEDWTRIDSDGSYDQLIFKPMEL